MINVSHLTCTDESGKPVITDATFNIDTNDRIAIVSGEQELASILCHAVSGIMHRTHPAYRVRGSVRVDGRQIEDIGSDERTEKIAYVPPNSDLLISGVKDTVFGEIALSLELTGAEPELIRKEVTKILKRLSIEKLSDREPDELSGGERHKVALASMIVREPDFLILDNPTMFLDHTGVRNLLGILRTYLGAIILADPNPYIWAPVVRRFIIILDSEVRILESPYELLSAIDEGDLRIELPSWSELYINLKENLQLSGENDILKSLSAIRTMTGALR